MIRMYRQSVLILAVMVFTATSAFAGGWSKDKGLDKMALSGELVCIGCTLKKLDGANAQCNLYSHHAIGFKAQDGTLWSIVDNAKGHDIIRSHNLLEKKKATISGYLYPLAHYIEIDTIKVAGVTPDEIAEAGFVEDKIMAKRLLTRVKGEAPTLEHKHEGHDH